MKKLLTAVLAAGLATGVISALITDSAYADGFTTGGLRGVVKDKTTGEPSVGATVVATSPALQGEQVVITDENGAYYITSLPPGEYTITVYYNDTTFSRNNVLVQLGKERSAPILRSMQESEVEELMYEVARIDNVRAEVVQQVMTEFVSAIGERSFAPLWLGGVLLVAGAAAAAYAVILWRDYLSNLRAH